MPTLPLPLPLPLPLTLTLTLTQELRSLGELLAPKLERLRPRLHPAVATALRRAVSAAHTRLQQPHRLRLSRGALPATSAAAGAAAGGGEPAEQ